LWLSSVHVQEGINGQFEEKKADLQPKVVEIYESVPAPLKVQTFKLLSLEHNLNSFNLCCAYEFRSGRTLSETGDIYSTESEGLKKRLF